MFGLGLGRLGLSGVGAAPALLNTLTPITTAPVAFAGGPSYLVESWVLAGNTVIQIEVGWASGVFVDCYTQSDGALYTAASGGTRIDSTYAGANKLLVHRIYNQGGSDPATDYISALADDKRVILDLTVPTAPAFAGYSTGTQDANQHATQRGYALPAGVTLKTNDHLLTLLAIHEWTAASQTEYLVQESATGTPQWRVDQGNYRQYASWNIAIPKTPESAAGSVTVPFLHSQWMLDDSRGLATDYTTRGGVNGVFQAGVVANSSATSSALNLFGPVSSLRGRSYGVLLFTTDVPLADMVFTGMPRRSARIISQRIQTDKPSIAYPLKNCVIPMNLGTGTADIPVKLIGKPSTAYEASWQGGAYVGVGTTGADGYLNGAMTGQAKGNGTFSVREVGRTTPVSITDVAVGIVVYAFGESGADGRGDDVTTTIPAGSLRTMNTRVNWTAASKEWWKLVVQKLYDTHACVIGVEKLAAGSSYFYSPGSGSPEGNWSVSPSPGTAQTLSSTGASRIIACQADFITPNLWLWDIGLNDASLWTSKEQFKTRFEDLLASYRERTGNNALTFSPIISGPNGAVSGAYTAGIRDAEIELWNEANGFTPAGSFAHLNVGADGVHLWTTADKEAARDVVWRTVYGAGRGPRFSSASATGSTITITATGGVTPLTITPGETLGWTISDNNGARTVTNVSTSGLVVTITVDQALVGTVAVKWCYGSTGIGTTLKDSDATTPLPIEPFQTVVSV